MCQSLIFNKVAETLAQVFPCEFCKIFKNTLFTEHLWATASVIVNWALLKELFREIYERFYFLKGIFPRVSLKFSGQINPSLTKLVVEIIHWCLYMSQIVFYCNQVLKF